MTTDMTAATAARPSEPREIAEFRREVRDKLAVYAIAERNPIPIQKAIIQQQCEDFLVEQFASSRPTPGEGEKKHAPECSRSRTDVDYAMFLPCTCHLYAALSPSPTGE